MDFQGAEAQGAPESSGEGPAQEEPGEPTEPSAMATLEDTPPEPIPAGVATDALASNDPALPESSDEEQDDDGAAGVAPSGIPS